MNNVTKRLSTCGVVIVVGLLLAMLTARRDAVTGAEPAKPFSGEGLAQTLSILLEVAADSNSPIKFDRQFKEFQLVYTRTQGNTRTVVTRPIQFCPWTGTQLPRSERAGAFHEPSRIETEVINRRLQNASNVEAVLRTLGKPDLTYSNNPSFKQQLTYTNLAKTFDVIVQENRDGQTSVFFLPKAKN